MNLEEADRGLCGVCGEWIIVLRDGTLCRHLAVTESDRATDGICSGSYSLPLEES